MFLRTAQTSAVEPIFTPFRLIRPILLYGSETRVHQLLVFERKVLRTICRPKIENCVYRRRYNHELDKEFDSPNALNVTKTSRFALRWSHNQKFRRERVACSIWNPHWNLWQLLWGGLIDSFFSPHFCTPKYGKCAHSYKFFKWNSIVFWCGSTQESQSAPYGFHAGIHMEDIRRDLREMRGVVRFPIRHF
jgi:hypothetical protein